MADWGEAAGKTEWEAGEVEKRVGVYGALLRSHQAHLSDLKAAPEKLNLLDGMTHLLPISIYPQAGDGGGGGGPRALSPGQAGGQDGVPGRVQEPLPGERERLALGGAESEVEEAGAVGVGEGEGDVVDGGPGRLVLAPGAQPSGGGNGRIPFALLWDKFAWCAGLQAGLEAHIAASEKELVDVQVAQANISKQCIVFARSIIMT